MAPHWVSIGLVRPLIARWSTPLRSVPSECVAGAFAVGPALVHCWCVELEVVEQQVLRLFAPLDPCRGSRGALLERGACDFRAGGTKVVFRLDHCWSSPGALVERGAGDFRAGGTKVAFAVVSYWSSLGALLVRGAILFSVLGSAGEWCILFQVQQVLRWPPPWILWRIAGARCNLSSEQEVLR